VNVGDLKETDNQHPAYFGRVLFPIVLAYFAPVGEKLHRLKRGMFFHLKSAIFYHWQLGVNFHTG